MEQARRANTKRVLIPKDRLWWVLGGIGLLLTLGGFPEVRLSANGVAYLIGWAIGTATFGFVAGYLALVLWSLLLMIVRYGRRITAPPPCPRCGSTRVSAYCSRCGGKLTTSR